MTQRISNAPEAAGAFTGRHMATILIAFFAVVIAVNFYMARVAIGSFGGTVVENSYVASQNYGRWLRAADAQARAGWQAQAAIEHGYLRVMLRRADKVVADAPVSAIARHPLGRVADRRLMLVPGSVPGRYRATAPLPAGRWRIEIIVRHGAEDARFLDDLRA